MIIYRRKTGPVSKGDDRLNLMLLFYIAAVCGWLWEVLVYWGTSGFGGSLTELLVFTGVFCMGHGRRSMAQAVSCWFCFTGQYRRERDIFLLPPWRFVWWWNMEPRGFWKYSSTPGGGIIPGSF